MGNINRHTAPCAIAGPQEAPNKYKEQSFGEPYAEPDVSKGRSWMDGYNEDLATMCKIQETKEDSEKKDIQVSLWLCVKLNTWRLTEIDMIKIGGLKAWRWKVVSHLVMQTKKPKSKEPTYSSQQFDHRLGQCLSKVVMCRNVNAPNRCLSYSSYVR